MKKTLPGLLVNGGLLFLAVATVTPLVWMVSASLMPTGEANSEPPRFFPSEITWVHYQDLFTRLDLGRHFVNSLLVASSITLLSLFLNSMAGYAFAKLRFPGRDRLFAFLLGAMIIPAQVSMLPLFLLMKYLGLVNTWWGVIFPSMATILGIFLIRQYALSIPGELLDAARIDGASELRIYRTIVLPLLRPVLVTLAVFTFLSAWNDFMWPLIILSDDSRYTLPVALANLSGEHILDTELMMAGAVLTVLPVIVMFLVLQRQYIAGITMGGVKE
jgi:multiple sugar transport system permease protein